MTSDGLFILVWMGRLKVTEDELYLGPKNKDKGRKDNGYTVIGTFDICLFFTSLLHLTIHVKNETMSLKFHKDKILIDRYIRRV